IAPATLCECVSVCDLARPGAQRIGVEREHDVGTVDARNDIERLAIGHHASRACRIVADRLIAIPTRLRVAFKQVLDLAEQGWRGDAPGDQAQTRSLALIF